MVQIQERWPGRQHFLVSHTSSRGFKTPRTFGVPKGLALKALPKAFVLATVLERLPVSAYWLTGHSLAMAISQTVPVSGSQKVLAFLSSNIAASSILAMTHFDTRIGKNATTVSSCRKVAKSWQDSWRDPSPAVGSPRT